MCHVHYKEEVLWKSRGGECASGRGGLEEKTWSRKQKMNRSLEEIQSLAPSVEENGIKGEVVMPC